MAWQTKTNEVGPDHSLNVLPLGFKPTLRSNQLVTSHLQIAPTAPHSPHNRASVETGPGYRLLSLFLYYCSIAFCGMQERKEGDLVVFGLGE